MHLLTEDSLKGCFKERKERDKASLVDGVTVKGYEDDLGEKIKDLVARMKAWRYRPKPQSASLYSQARRKEKATWYSRSRGQDRPDGSKEDP